jgi:predicted nuclease of predicted toxin-antitoxin system
MKFKLDENFGPSALEVFQQHGADCQTVLEEKLGGADDKSVLASAVAENRVLVTLDRDVTNVLQFPPEQTSGVAVMLPGRRASRELLTLLIESFLAACEQKLIRGKLWIIEPGRIREHRLDDDALFGDDADSDPNPPPSPTPTA